jgi:Secretion system C-terminal sorting domain
MQKNTLLLFLFTLSATITHAKIWQVGPSRTFLKPSAVANFVTDGDTIHIDAGIYLGDVAKWFANKLVFKGIGTTRAHLKADGNNAEGKAIWVIKGSNCKVENIEFSGCTVPDQNGAGIRQEGQNLTLINCFFHHNEMGILTNNDGISDYVFESCEFAFNGFGDGYSHNIYVGHVHSLTMRACYTHDAKIGHLVKSRAEQNFLYYNRITGENGDGSYEIDLPNGGLAILVGNIIEQAATSENGGIISFGLEGATNVEQKIALSHNTIVNLRFSGRFVQFATGSQITLKGNMFLGSGDLLQGTASMLDTSLNIRLLDIADANLMDVDNFDFRPTANAPCVDAGVLNVGNVAGFLLTPEYVYVHPLGSAPRNTSGLKPDIGAYEFLQSSKINDFGEEKNVISAYPNPFIDHIFIKNKPENAVCQLFDVNGKKLFLGVDLEKQDFSGLLSGVYFLKIEFLGMVKIVK